MITFKLGGYTYEAAYDARRDLTVIKPDAVYKNPSSITIDKDNHMTIRGLWPIHPVTVEEFVKDTNFNAVCRNQWEQSIAILDIARNRILTRRNRIPHP